MDQTDPTDEFVGKLAGSKRTPYVSSKPEMAQEKSYRRTAILICVAALSIVLVFYSGILGDKNLAAAKMIQGVVKQQKAAVVTANALGDLVPLSANNCFENGVCVYVYEAAKVRLDAGQGIGDYAYICVSGDGSQRPVSDPTLCGLSADYGVVPVPTSTAAPQSFTPTNQSAEQVPYDWGTAKTCVANGQEVVVPSYAQCDGETVVIQVPTATVVP